eukprot:1563828-Lingulodinium_polyedra.AAC.1
MPHSLSQHGLAPHYCKNTTPVMPDPVLFVSSHTYALRAIVEHTGPSPHSGHYLCHVRETDGSGYLTYDDDKT